MGDPDPGSADSPSSTTTDPDFENFTPRDMAAMDLDDWETHFDPETWITGPFLLDRVEADLKRRIADRELFAVVERTTEHELLAYSDEGYVQLHTDGTLTGDGIIYQEIEPIVALCAMDTYEPPEMPPDDALLPHPDTIASGSGSLGNRLIELLGLVQLLAGLILLISPLIFQVPGNGSAFLTTVTGLGFIVIGLFLFFIVANARLSDRFRAEEYRDRLISVGVGTDQKPDFLPSEQDSDDSE